ncbi:DNA repair protein RadC [uncultured Brevundimonas sp.]|uniref:RadC family protein n=1 Tax=uncultured Brevundimonas sp. TaxID=213418 RepID=UPI0030EBD052|tara:strand:- start:10330 stop:11103 length:774 start_codon:yes stop_codon:yes gene_type:complete
MSSVLPFPITAPRAPRAAPKGPGTPKPHHTGHRERLRQRARGAGLQHLPDYELLELFLFRSQPRGDVKPVAKALLARFGSLAAVLAAPVEDLLTVKTEDSRGQHKGIGGETALDLAALHEVARRIAREEPAKRPVISSWTALLAYVRLALQHEPREQFRALYLDNRNQLILDEIQNRGTVDHAPVYPREVVRRALELSAKAMILVHNHPSGDPTPSRADIEMTRQVVAAARTLGLEVHDHLVVGREGVASFKQLGLM